MEERRRFPPSGAAVATASCTIWLNLFHFHAQGYSNSKLNSEGTRSSVNSGMWGNTSERQSRLHFSQDLPPKNEWWRGAGWHRLLQPGEQGQRQKGHALGMTGRTWCFPTVVSLPTAMDGPSPPRRKAPVNANSGMFYEMPGQFSSEVRKLPQLTDA